MFIKSENIRRGWNSNPLGQSPMDYQPIA